MPFPNSNQRNMGLGFTIFVIGYLEKGACRERGALKQGEQENSSGQYLSLSMQFVIRTPGNKQLFVWLQEPCKVKQLCTKYEGSNSRG
jgi:hypothetical protein